MAEVVVGALLLRRLIGPRAAIDRAEQVGGLFAALAVATAISATVGMVSMLAGGVITAGEAPTFWRTWWLGDVAGALVVVPLVLAWAGDPGGAWRRLRTAEGALLIATVATLGALAVSTSEPVTYVVFPALIWAASRFGTPGATLSIAIATGVAIGITANDVGPFFKQPIDHRTLSTQVYIVVTAMTTLFLAAMVSERERATRQLAGPSAARANRRCRSATGSRATCTTPSPRRCSPRCCTPARPRRRWRRTARTATAGSRETWGRSGS